MSAFDFRTATESDIPAICAVVNTAHRFDDVPQVLSVDELAEEFADGVDMSSDVLVAVTTGPAAELVGCIYTNYLPSDVLWERCYLPGDVHPDYRGQGIGRQLLAWGIERGTAQLRSSGNALPKYLRVEMPEEAIGRRQLFDRFGFRHIRTYEDMLRPLDNLPPLRQVDGVRIVPWTADRDGEALAVKNIAFADHWGSTPEAPASWALMVHGFGSWSEQSFFALSESGEVIGYVLNHRYAADDTLIGRSDGWIDNLGVLPSWRGKGIASALITHTLHAFRSAGMTHASIGVDSKNLTGAARLYKSLGFEVDRRGFALQIEVRA